MTDSAGGWRLLTAGRPTPTLRRHPLPLAHYISQGLYVAAVVFPNPPGELVSTAQLFQVLAGRKFLTPSSQDVVEVIKKKCGASQPPIAEDRKMLPRLEMTEVIRCLAVFFIASFLIRQALKFLGRRSRLPPGPVGLPLLGYLPFLRPEAHLQFAEMSAKYGGIFSLSLGNQFVVVLSDYRLIREAFRREDFTGRPDTEFTNILGGYGMYIHIPFENEA